MERSRRPPTPDERSILLCVPAVRCRPSAVLHLPVHRHERVRDEHNNHDDEEGASSDDATDAARRSLFTSERRARSLLTPDSSYVAVLQHPPVGRVQWEQADDRAVGRGGLRLWGHWAANLGQAPGAQEAGGGWGALKEGALVAAVRRRCMLLMAANNSNTRQLLLFIIPSVIIISSAARRLSCRRPTALRATLLLLLLLRDQMYVIVGSGMDLIMRRLSRCAAGTNRTASGRNAVGRGSESGDE